MRFEEGFRADLLVHDLVPVELKSVENLAPVHGKQVLTYLRPLKMPLGPPINFGAPTFKDGIKRIVNQHRYFAASREPIPMNRHSRAHFHGGRSNEGGHI